MAQMQFLTGLEISFGQRRHYLCDFEPLHFMAGLAALVPKPRVNLTRFHGMFSPNSKFRITITITPARRGKGLQGSARLHSQKVEKFMCRLMIFRGQELEAIGNYEYQDKNYRLD